MTPNPQLKEGIEKLARRGVYCLVMGVGAFFAYFNSIHGWIAPTGYSRVKGAWLEPFMPAIEPYLPQIVISLGVGLLLYAAYCFYQYLALTKASG